MFRSINEIVTLSSQSKSQYGVKHTPLLDIGVDYYEPDKLHLMLRLTEMLFRHLRDDYKNVDQKRNQ